MNARVPHGAAFPYIDVYARAHMYTSIRGDPSPCGTRRDFAMKPTDKNTATRRLRLPGNSGTSQCAATFSASSLQLMRR